MYEEFFSLRLSQLRLQKGVSARDMSLSIGQNENYINHIENKKAFPSMQAFFYICEYLGVTPKDFFDENKQTPTLIDEFLTELIKLDEDKIRHLLRIVQAMAVK